MARLTPSPLAAVPGVLQLLRLAFLEPLETAIVDLVKAWLPKLAYPIRLGMHSQSMFAFGLMLDWARTVGDAELEQLLAKRSLAFHREDRDCPMAYEPSGEDFLSRAWNLRNIANALPPADPRIAALRAAADRHADHNDIQKRLAVALQLDLLDTVDPQELSSGAKPSSTAHHAHRRIHSGH